MSMTLGRAWLLVRQDVRRGLLATCHDRVTASRLLSHGAPLPTKTSTPNLPPVHVLSGEEQWLMTAWMLASWFHATQSAWDVYVHDDGSLSKVAIRSMESLAPSIHIISRSTADRTMQNVLAPFPRCRDYRAHHPLGLKCFDIPQFTKGSRYIMLDSDVLFFKKPAFVLEWAQDTEATTTWFNQDPKEPSPISSEACQQAFGFKLWPKVNSGLSLIHKDIISLNHFEDWLTHPDIAKGNAWRTEQTLLALAASRKNQGGLLDQAYEVSLGKRSHPDCIARHYVGAVRQRFYGEGIHKLRHRLLQS